MCDGGKVAVIGKSGGEGGCCEGVLYCGNQVDRVEAVAWFPVG